MRVDQFQLWEGKHMSLVRNGIAAAVIATFAGMGAAQADQMSYTFSSINIDGTNGQWSLGYEFSPNSNISVDQLAIFDDGQNRGSVHAVGIFNSSGTLLASVNITQGTNVNGFFDWAKIGALTLQGGQDYYIAEETGTSNYTYNVNGFTPNSDITYIADAFTLSSTLVFPNGGCCTTTDGYFGPNFAFNSVPEPGTLAIMGAGLAGFGGWRLRRKAKAA